MGLKIDVPPEFVITGNFIGNFEKDVYFEKYIGLNTTKQVSYQLSGDLPSGVSFDAGYLFGTPNVTNRNYTIDLTATLDGKESWTTYNFNIINPNTASTDNELTPEEGENPGDVVIAVTNPNIGGDDFVTPIQDGHDINEEDLPIGSTYDASSGTFTGNFPEGTDLKGKQYLLLGDKLYWWNSSGSIPNYTWYQDGPHDTIGYLGIHKLGDKVEHFLGVRGCNEYFIGGDTVYNKDTNKIINLPPLQNDKIYRIGSEILYNNKYYLLNSGVYCNTTNFELDVTDGGAKLWVDLRDEKNSSYPYYIQDYDIDGVYIRDTYVLLDGLVYRSLIDSPLEVPSIGAESWVQVPVYSYSSNMVFTTDKIISDNGTYYSTLIEHHNFAPTNTDYWSELGDEVDHYQSEVEFRTLPKGLSFSRDGYLRGVIDKSNDIGEYTFTVNSIGEFEGSKTYTLEIIQYEYRLERDIYKRVENKVIVNSVVEPSCSETGDKELIPYNCDPLVLEHEYDLFGTDNLLLHFNFHGLYIQENITKQKILTMDVPEEPDLLCVDIPEADYGDLEDLEVLNELTYDRWRHAHLEIYFCATVVPCWSDEEQILFYGKKNYYGFNKESFTDAVLINFRTNNYDSWWDWVEKNPHLSETKLANYRDYYYNLYEGERHGILTFEPGRTIAREIASENATIKIKIWRRGLSSTNVFFQGLSVTNGDAWTNRDWSFVEKEITEDEVDMNLTGDPLPEATIFDDCIAPTIWPSGGTYVAETCDGVLSNPGSVVVGDLVAIDDSWLEVEPDTTITGNVITGNNSEEDYDTEGRSFEVITNTVYTNSYNIEVNIAADGSFTYQVPSNFDMEDYFTYTIENTDGQTDSARVTISPFDEIVTPVDPPSGPCDFQLDQSGVLPRINLYGDVGSKVYDCVDTVSGTTIPLLRTKSFMTDPTVNVKIKLEGGDGHLTSSSTISGVSHTWDSTERQYVLDGPYSDINTILQSLSYICGDCEEKGEIKIKGIITDSQGNESFLADQVKLVYKGGSIEPKGSKISGVLKGTIGYTSGTISLTKNGTVVPESTVSWNDFVEDGMAEFVRKCRLQIPPAKVFITYQRQGTNPNILDVVLEYPKGAGSTFNGQTLGITGTGVSFNGNSSGFFEDILSCGIDGDGDWIDDLIDFGIDLIPDIIDLFDLEVPDDGKDGDGQKEIDVAFLYKGRKVRVPDVYNPSNHSYSSEWNLNTFPFKVVWTDDPAWCLLDYLTNTDYGCGKIIPLDQEQLYVLYTDCYYASKRNNERVNGNVRYTINTAIEGDLKKVDVVEYICSSFHSRICWANGYLRIVQDRPSTSGGSYRPNNPKMIAIHSTVLDGDFSYTGTSNESFVNYVNVGWQNPEQYYEENTVTVQSNDTIDRLGKQDTNVVSYGTNNEPQAIRHGAWILNTEGEKPTTINFTGGLDFIDIVPGDWIYVHDNYLQQDLDFISSGRFKEIVNSNTIILDRDISGVSGDTIYIPVIDDPISSVIPAHVLPGTRIYSSGFTFNSSTNTITLSNPLPVSIDNFEDNHPWFISNSNNLEIYMVTNVSENNYVGNEIVAIKVDPDKYNKIDNTGV